MQMASFFELHFILAGRSFGLESTNNLAWRWHSYYRLTIGRIYFTTPFEMGKAEGTKSARENNALGFFRHGPFLMVIYEDIHTRRNVQTTPFEILPLTYKSLDLLGMCPVWHQTVFCFIDTNMMFLFATCITGLEKSTHCGWKPSARWTQLLQFGRFPNCEFSTTPALHRTTKRRWP
jgi:hypothetical protein